MPITTPDKERTGLIVEAMCAASRKYIVPAYYDKVLTGKLIRDTESEEMLDVIFGSQIFDFGICYCENLDFIPLKSLIESKKKRYRHMVRQTREADSKKFRRPLRVYTRRRIGGIGEYRGMRWMRRGTVRRPPGPPAILVL